MAYLHPMTTTRPATVRVFRSFRAKVLVGIQVDSARDGNFAQPIGFPVFFVLTNGGAWFRPTKVHMPESADLAPCGSSI